MKGKFRKTPIRAYTLVAFLGLFFLTAFNLHAQNRQEIEKQRKKAQRDIELTHQLLEKKKNEKKLSIGKLELINTQIRSREKVIRSISQEIQYQELEILQRQKKIERLNRDLDRLKTEYARMVYYAARNRSSYERLMFLLSAEDFNQAFRRLKYLQQYNEYRRRQASMIQKARIQIEEELGSLQKVKAEKEGLVVVNKLETSKLGNERVQQSQVISQLKADEQKLRKQLKEKEAISRKLQAAIEAIIREEARKAAEEAARRAAAAAEKARLEAAKTGAPKPTPKPETPSKTAPVSSYALTPEETMISSGLGSNKGRLIWPTERGVITSRFGQHPHPVIPSVMVYNNGVDITTPAGTIVRSVYEGEVREVISIQGGNGAVIIRHGNFLTVYQNLRDISVRKGQKVTAKQKIGVACTDGSDDGKSVVHFEIWKETSKMDPEAWLSRN